MNHIRNIENREYFDVIDPQKMKPITWVINQQL